MTGKPKIKICALAGGVGGARLADGFYRSEKNVDLTVIVNIGDDFDHFGLRICPDIDTVCYTLAGIANPVTGWGLLDESWVVFRELKNLAAPTWFALGDRDIATHLERTRLIQQGYSLSAITQRFCDAWGINCRVLPATDDLVPTIVHTKTGTLTFQEYFVKERCEPPVKGFDFHGIENAQPAQGVIEAIDAADVVVFCPSNPWVSIDPILEIAGIRDTIMKKTVISVSPIIGGETVKGPAAKMYAELGINPSAFAVAEHYHQCTSIFILDDIDIDLKPKIEQLGITTYSTDILIKEIHARIRLANEIINLIPT